MVEGSLSVDEVCDRMMMRLAWNHSLAIVARVRAAARQQVRDDPSAHDDGTKVAAASMSQNQSVAATYRGVVSERRRIPRSRN